MIKRFILAVTLAVIVANAAAAYNLNFTIFNRSGSRVNKILLSPSWNDDFDQEYDLITRGNTGRPTTISNGGSEKISLDNLTDGRQNCRYWDLYVVCADGRKGMWRGIDLRTVVGVRIDRNLTLHTFTASDILDMF